MDTHSQSIKFIGHFLQWYQDSYSQPDVVNHIKLLDLVKEAESIHTEVVKAINEDIDRLAKKTAEDTVKLYNKKYKNTTVQQKCSLLEEVYRTNLNKKNRKKKRISKFL